MLFSVTFKSGKPVYLQLVDQVRAAAASGALRSGDALPSIRPLAEELRVNRNTVAKAYAELEGHFAFVVMHHDHPDLLVGARDERAVRAGVGLQAIALLAARHDVPLHVVQAGQGLEKHGGVVALLARDPRLHRRERVGVGTSVSWPTGVGGNGNEGVAGAILNTPYSIGYIELSYASTLNVKYAAIRNHEGEFILPSLEAGTTAASGAVDNLPPSHESWSRVSFTNAPGPGAYPISSFSYYFIYEDLATLGPHVTKETAQRILDWIAWSVTEGQQYNTDVRNAPIPHSVQVLNLEGLRRVNWNGQPLELNYGL